MHFPDAPIPDVQYSTALHRDSNNLSHVLIKKAVELGCEQAVVIHTKTIVTGRWVQLKCKYGCEEYGKKLTCPPHSPSYEEMKEILGEYHKALLLHGHMSWQMRYITAVIEKEAFSLGFYKAFGLGAGPCMLCENCITSSSCTRTEEARPSMEACGIDVYQTARNHNLKIQTLKDKSDEVNIYGLVLLE
jgi:predicted metal-binding protein